MSINSARTIAFFRLEAWKLSNALADLVSMYSEVPTRGTNLRDSAIYRTGHSYTPDT